jgi:hypothetical protein
MTPPCGTAEAWRALALSRIFAVACDRSIALCPAYLDPASGGPLRASWVRFGEHGLGEPGAGILDLSQIDRRPGFAV